ncbi:MAG: TolC family protein [Xanthomonadales bacterium]|nr:TolC family protein [Xanthomonadales bacterium]
MSFAVATRASALACGALLSTALAVGTARAESTLPAELPCAVRGAWSAHPAFAATESTLAAARARAQAASKPLYNPELELAYDRDGDERTTTAGLSLTLDLSGKRAARETVGAADLSLAEAEAALQRSGFAQQWLLAAVGRRAALARVALGEQRLALMQRFADLAERQLQAGDIAPLERDLALLARNQADAEQATLLGDLAAAEEAFRAVGGDPGAAPVDGNCPAPAVGQLTDRFDPFATPEGRVALASATSVEGRVRLAERERRADPTISLNAGRLDVGSASDNVLGVAISVPLQFRNPYRAELVAAQADAEAARAEQKRVELELRARAERSLRTSEALQQAWSRWSKGPGPQLTERADLLERLWRAGELSTADFLTQLNQSLDTAFAGSDLQSQASRATVEALYATGRLDAWVGFDRPFEKTTP